jgi:hypothetical protein
VQEGEEIVLEIEALLEEQFRALDGKLSAFEVAEYAQRKQRIQQLLEHMAGNRGACE